VLTSEAAGLGFCDLVLGTVGDETNVAAHVEEVTGRLWMARGGQAALGDLTSWAPGLVLREPNRVPLLAVAMSPSSLLGPSEMQVSVVALNQVQWGGGAAGADRHPVTLP
jgi:hypothetical protein